MGGGRSPHDLRDTVENTAPISRLGLAEQPHGRIPGVAETTLGRGPLESASARSNLALKSVSGFSHKYLG
jgi:hypothetical protein